ncbi:conserved hypothetical protein [Denitrovibrio acetiphilus DSM 12809]|uniref:Transporter n=1 Tax=Denitrovibrio acetiphilus (strain DSM 12809 / NBRC 114555 / N2460) TaxID=522772 RepID=D4H8J5_DENA2|nr:transporter [Denitrovibrio acetiphilus]ADD68344.1 conserved hypothetical protein [Denitrovibrio acetiphilus DSM 12809]
MKVTNLSSIFAKSFITAALFAFITFIPVLSNADQHYGIGSEGLKAGTVPGPGFYYLMYNNYYTSDTMTDSSGDDSNIGFDISVIANVNRFVYITDKKILGADYGFQLIVPFVYTDLEIKAAGVDDDDFSLSDITVEPLILSWHGAQYDAVFGTALFVPTGEYDKNSSVNIGQDHYTVMLSQGITYYIGEGKGWNISYIARYEKHLENRDLDITYGDDFSVDWGIGKTINKFYDIGLIGYSHWQVTDDDGDDAAADSVKDQVHAIGLEAGVFFPDNSFGVKVKYQNEFYAEDRAKGHSFWIDIVKPF